MNRYEREDEDSTYRDAYASRKDSAYRDAYASRKDSAYRDAYASRKDSAYRDAYASREDSAYRDTYPSSEDTSYEDAYVLREDRNRYERFLAWKKEEERKRRRKKTTLIVICAALVVAIGVGAVILIPRIGRNISESQNIADADPAMTSEAASQDETLSQETEEAAAAEAASQEAAAAQNAQAEALAATRQSFPVQPGVPCGSDTMSEEKVVYITLDDGPSECTIKALDIMDRYGIKCTFFVTAQDPDYFYLIKEAYDRGHTIGLHTYSHDYASIYSSVDAYFQDLDQIGQVVADQIGYVPCFIRFPGGSSNTVSANYCSGIMSTLVQEVQNRGYQYYDWNVSSGDGNASITNPEELAGNAINCDAQNIVLLSHDSAGKDATMEALPLAIEYYLSQGYTFKALDREAFTAHHGVNN